MSSLIRVPSTRAVKKATALTRDGHVAQALVAQHPDVFEIVALLDEADGLLDAPAAEIGGHHPPQDLAVLA